MWRFVAHERCATANHFPIGGKEPERLFFSEGTELVRLLRTELEPRLSLDGARCIMGVALPPCLGEASLVELRPMGGNIGGRLRSRDVMRLPSLEPALVLAEEADLSTEDPAAANLEFLSFTEEGKPEPRRTKAWPFGFTQLVPAPEAPTFGSAFAAPW